MLFNFSDIQTSFRTVVGWHQNQDPQGLKLTSLTTSDSGIYMQGVHPLLTLANLQSICPDFSLYVYPDYNVETPYVVGDIVKSGDTDYRCIQANTGEAVTETDYWEVWTAGKAFTLWLQNRMDSATSMFLNDWIGRKFENRSANNIIEREQLYTATGSNADKITNEADTVAGLEFRVIRSQGARAYIRKVSLHLDTAQNLTVYLYKSGNREAVQSTTLSYTNTGDVQWFDLEWELKGEGAYYLCYSRNDLTGQAYNDGNERTAWSTGWQLPGSQYLKAHPFTAGVVNVSGVGSDEIENTLVVGGSEVFLTSNIEYVTDTNGLNVQFYVGCSYTDLLIEQRKNFAQAYSLFLAKSLLNELLHNASTRVNRNEENVIADEIRYALNGVAMNNNFSIQKQYERAVSALMLDLTGIDNVCLPCKKQGRLQIGTI